MQEYLLTMTGPDKPGIVASLAGIVSNHDGNWLESRLMRLGGTFSGILRIELAEPSTGPFEGEVAAFMKDAGYEHVLKKVQESRAPEEGPTVNLNLSGQDHPGIVHAIFQALQEMGANVEELRTGLEAAPWSGTPVFQASARIRLPQPISLDSLQARLEEITGDLLVEVSLQEEAP